MNCLFDTSALVKLVINEEGTADTVDLWDRTAVPLASRLAQPELVAALAAAERAGRIRRTASSGRLDDVLDRLTWIELGLDEGNLAAELAENHVLSGADAVHLACGVAVLTEQDVVATFDRQQRKAAVELGYALFPAELPQTS